MENPENYEHEIDELVDWGLEKLRRGNLDEVEAVLRDIRDLSKPPQTPHTYLRVDGIAPEDFDTFEDNAGHSGEPDEAKALANTVYAHLESEFALEPDGVVPIANPNYTAITIPAVSE